MTSNFKIRLVAVPEKAQARIVHIAGEVDESSIDEFKKYINEYIQTPEVNTFVFFLRDLEFINSMVIGYLAEVFSKLRQVDKKMILAEGNEKILDILELVGFLNLAEHHTNIDDALNSLDF